MHRERLEILERCSRQLDPAPDEFDAWLRELGRVSRRFLVELADAKAYGTFDRSAYREDRFEEDGRPLPQALDDAMEKLVDRGYNPPSGRTFGYVVGGGLPVAAVADVVAALTDRYAGVFLLSPGAVEIENSVVAWMRDLVGYPTGAWGTLTSGGTVATLAAVVSARTTRESGEWPRSVIYHTDQIHNAAQKALAIAGMHDCPRRVVPRDDGYRMDPAALERLIAEDRARGLSPWIVMASAGTVNTGAVDPLAELGRVCSRHRLWFHVDAAYGGFFLLVPDKRPDLAGLEASDSVVLDPHKGLFLPYGCGAVLVRDPSALRRGMSFSGSYLEDALDDEVRSPSDYSPELSRHFRGLRVWLALRVHGLGPFRAALEEKLLLAQRLQAELEAAPSLAVVPGPQLSCVVFRHVGGDEATRSLGRALLSRGRVHVSETRLDDRLHLRACILTFRAHAADVRELVEEVRALAG